MSQFVIVDETSKAMVFGGNKSALKDAQQPAAPGIDLEQFRKLSRDMRKFIDNWDTTGMTAGIIEDMKRGAEKAPEMGWQIEEEYN